MHTHFLIIGSGIAGLSLALKLAEEFPNKRICIVTKSNSDESNTKYAQGGMAVVTNSQDSIQKHIDDTLKCGAGLCNKEVVELVIKNGPDRLQELINWGAQFDLDSNNNFELGKEGGHSENRVVHRKDHTGYEIEKTMLAQAKKYNNIILLDFHFAIDLIVSENTCVGAYVLNEKTNQINSYNAFYTILATGGIGQVYGHTTNPIIATGDGIAMALRAKAIIKDMEFIQFHPTAMYCPNMDVTFLISEALRGFGAYLKNKNGERFVFNDDARGELASRDIVSQSIYMELKRSGEPCVYMDCTHLNQDDLKHEFPMIYNKCLSVEIYLEKDWIPVAPSQHYLCGGIEVNLNGQTSIHNLFACGECSNTGLHGANRLASNSLLEALVFSDFIYDFIRENYAEKEEFPPSVSIENYFHKTLSDEFLVVWKKKIQQVMIANAGIVRQDSELLLAKNLLMNWKEEFLTVRSQYDISKKAIELENIIDIALIIIDHSLNRKLNVGAFLKKD